MPEFHFTQQASVYISLCLLPYILVQLICASLFNIMFKYYMAVQLTVCFHVLTWASDYVFWGPDRNWTHPPRALIIPVDFKCCCSLRWILNTFIPGGCPGYQPDMLVTAVPNWRILYVLRYYPTLCIVALYTDTGKPFQYAAVNDNTMWCYNWGFRGEKNRGQS